MLQRSEVEMKQLAAVTCCNAKTPATASIKSQKGLPDSLAFHSGISHSKV